MIFVPYLKTCRSEGAHLAFIHSLWENKFVGALEPSFRVWLGGTDSAKEGTWKWTDEINISYANTGTKESPITSHMELMCLKNVPICMHFG